MDFEASICPEQNPMLNVQDKVVSYGATNPVRVSRSKCPKRLICLQCSVHVADEFAFGRGTFFSVGIQGVAPLAPPHFVSSKNERPGRKTDASTDQLGV